MGKALRKKIPRDSHAPNGIRRTASPSIAEMNGQTKSAAGYSFN
jgi:hypothetical protein